jgi:hypothetical protein
MDVVTEAMPKVDKVLWFAVVPVAWVSVAFSVDAVYDNPMPYLLDAWMVLALGSWVLRRPYIGWARILRWVVLVAWIGALASHTTAT